MKGGGHSHSTASDKNLKINFLQNYLHMKSYLSVSPIDGRYHKQTADLAMYFSEFALMKYRVRVEIEYFIALVDLGLPFLKDFPIDTFEQLRQVYTDFQVVDCEKVKEIEKTTNHDVKAVEYFVKEKFDEIGIAKYKEYIHFGLTSQDINNTATPMTLKDGLREVYYPNIQIILSKLSEYTDTWKDVSMLARTHGQPASPTKLGKELNVFQERLQIQLIQLKAIPFSAKFGGATGNFNAHHVAFPHINWIEFADNFVNIILQLTRSKTTTQIEHYDNLAAIFDALKRINTILIDMCRDMWTYISMDYFKQKISKNEVGSSAMPHKVNPIDFENAEGNLAIANSFFEFLSAKLPISRLQRDLTDSTVLRNIGVPIAHTVIALKSLTKGLDKITLNESKIINDLEENWMVVAEGIQTILRREGYSNPYELLKDLTRNNSKIDGKAFQNFIDGLKVNNVVAEELKKITPFSYTGI